MRPVTGSDYTLHSLHSLPRIIGSGIRIKLGIWRELSEDRHLASSLVAEDPEESGELTLSAHTDTDTDTGIWRVWVEIIYFQLNFF